MRSRGFNSTTDLEDLESNESLANREDMPRKEYRRHRSLRTARRSSSRMGGSQPGVGIGGRRNRRWSW